MCTLLILALNSKTFNFLVNMAKQQQKKVGGIKIEKLGVFFFSSGIILVLWNWLSPQQLMSGVITQTLSICNIKCCLSYNNSPKVVKLLNWKLNIKILPVINWIRYHTG